MDIATKLEIIRKHYAIASVGGTILRSQCESGGKDKAQDFLLKKFNLDELSLCLSDNDFTRVLDNKTEELSKCLIIDGKPNWGGARKVINIFLKLCAANKGLNSNFKLYRLEPFFEVPLDNHVVESIDMDAGTKFHNGFKIKILDPKKSSRIQNVANLIAEHKGIYRYELDYIYWNYRKVK